MACFMGKGIRQKLGACICFGRLGREKVQALHSMGRKWAVLVQRRWNKRKKEMYRLVLGWSVSGFSLREGIMGWLMSSPNSYVEVLTPTTSEQWLYLESLKRWLNWNQVIRLCSNLIWPLFLPEVYTQTQTEEKPCEDMWGRWPFASQGERSQEKPPLRIPWSWTFRLQNREEMNFGCWSPCLWHFVLTVVAEWSWRPGLL